MTLRAQASAKVILMGEHFVLPWIDESGISHVGSSALAVPLPELFTDVKISQVPKGQDECCFSLPHSEQAPQSVLPLMKEAIRSISLLAHQEMSFRVSSKSSFPISRGLGSSASFSVALTQAFLKLSEVKPSEEEIFGMAQHIENLFHGKSSGLDTAVVLKAKPILFKNGKSFRSFEIRSADLVIVDSGPREGSAQWIQRASEFRRENTKRWTTLSRWIDEKVEEALDLLEATNGARALGSLLNETHEILSQMGLTTPAIEEVLRIAKQQGCLGGKLSGAGGGGATLLLTEPGEGEFLKKRLRNLGLSVLTTVSAKL